MNNYNELINKPTINGKELIGDVNVNVLHHYSTNEQVIGTWIDGETLYERTFNELSTNTNGDNWVNISGIDATTWKDVVNVEIYCNSSDVNNKLTRIALSEARVFNGNVQVTASASTDRQINVATIQYTKVAI